MLPIFFVLSSCFVGFALADGAGDGDRALVFRDAEYVFAMRAFEIHVREAIALFALAELACAAEAFGLFHIPIALAAALDDLFRKTAEKDVDEQKRSHDVQDEKEGEGKNKG